MCFLTSAIQYFKKSSSKISSLFPSFPKLPSVKKKDQKSHKLCYLLREVILRCFQSYNIVLLHTCAKALKAHLSLDALCITLTALLFLQCQFLRVLIVFWFGRVCKSLQDQLKNNQHRHALGTIVAFLDQ